MYSNPQLINMFGIIHNTVFVARYSQDNSDTETQMICTYFQEKKTGETQTFLRKDFVEYLPKTEGCPLVAQSKYSYFFSVELIQMFIRRLLSLTLCVGFHVHKSAHKKRCF